MWSRARAALAGVLLGAALAACTGYAPEGRAPLLLPGACRDLYIASVENPTLRPDLSARLRELLRDELAKRGRVRWTDRDQATALVNIAVHDFSSRTALTGSREETIKSTASIDLEAWIERRPEGGELWRSGRVSLSQSFLGGGREDAEAKVLEMAAQRLADLLGQAY